MADYIMAEDVDRIASMIEVAVNNEDVSALAAICVHLKGRASYWRGVARERERLLNVMIGTLEAVSVKPNNGMID